MKSITMILALILSLGAFAQTDLPHSPPSGPSLLESRIELQIDIVGTAAQIARLTDLSKIAEQVINGSEFRSRVRKSVFTYTDLKGDQVMDRLIDGNEILLPQKDNIWQLKFVFEPKSRKCVGIGRFKKCSNWVLGWTNPSIKTIYLNSLPWPDRDDCGIVGTIVHEQTHKLGFGHPYEPTKKRPQSVPYSTGTIASDICKQLKMKIVHAGDIPNMIGHYDLVPIRMDLFPMAFSYQ